MKNLFYLIFIFFYFFSNAQNFKYGPILGSKFAFTDITSKTSLEGGAYRIGLNLGVFGDYQINESFGLKSDLILNTTKEDSYNDRRIGQFGINRLFNDANITSLQLNLYIKYDVNREYDKGFYGLAGLNFTNILNDSYKNDDTNDIQINNFYKNFSSGLLIGFGTSMGSKLNYEMVFQYGLTNLIIEPSKTDYFGLFINFSYTLNR